MAPYLTDWRGRYRGEAACVARPASTREVRATVQWAGVHRVAIVPQGGNTGLAGGATPNAGTRALVDTRPQVVLSLNRMDAVRNVDRIGMTLEVEAGCIVEQAKKVAARAGRYLPISFGAQGSATVGGMISTNAGGSNALRHGTVRQFVLGVEAVLADGSVVGELGGLRKDNAGWDWKQLLIGSEGTLGVVTAAVLRLLPLPSERALAFVALESPEAALALLERFQDQMGDAVTAFELMSGPTLDLVIRHLGAPSPLNPTPWCVLIEVADSAGDLRRRFEAALAAAAKHGSIEDTALAESTEHARRFWTLRESIAEAERRQQPSAKHDVSVPVTRVPAFLREVETALAQLGPGLQIIAFGHLGDGNLHYNVAGQAAGIADADITRVVHDVVAGFGGSISAEHGIGQYRIAELGRLKPVAELALLRRLKCALDPDELFNPGKVLPEP